MFYNLCNSLQRFGLVVASSFFLDLLTEQKIHINQNILFILIIIYSERRLLWYYTCVHSPATQRFLFFPSDSIITTVCFFLYIVSDCSMNFLHDWIFIYLKRFSDPTIEIKKTQSGNYFFFVLFSIDFLSLGLFFLLFCFVFTMCTVHVHRFGFCFYSQLYIIDCKSSAAAAKKYVVVGRAMNPEIHPTLTEMIHIVYTIIS